LTLSPYFCKIAMPFKALLARPQAGDFVIESQHHFFLVFAHFFQKKKIRFSMSNSDKDWVRENCDNEVFMPRHFDGEENLCDGCWIEIKSGEYTCKGGCQRENASVVNDVTCISREHQKFCLECHEKFVKTSEGHSVCSTCALLFDECNKCGEIIVDEFTWIGDKKYALTNECRKCLPERIESKPRVVSWISEASKNYMVFCKDECGNL